MIINIEYCNLDQMMNLGYVLDSGGCYNKCGMIYIDDSFDIVLLILNKKWKKIKIKHLEFYKMMTSQWYRNIATLQQLFHCKGDQFICI